MKSHTFLGLILISSFFLSGCSKKGKSSTAQLEISLGAIVGASFSGGVLVLAKNEKTGETQTIEMHMPYHVTLPFGVWSIYIAGFEGSSQWQGPNACGGIEKVDFAKDDQTVQIKVAESNCLSEPYLALIGTKGASWDVAVWDKSNWQ